ncbi:HEC/Ndc80p family protein-like protein [Phyllosticta capitalensis]
MSQEPGLFSVRRPRETLGGLNNNLSAIPMPSSAMKRSSSNSNLAQTHGRNLSSGGRMSLAPSRPPQPSFHRSSSGNNLADMGFSSVHRNSNANAFGSASGRKSYAPSATPAPSMGAMDQGSQRRSSVWSSARPSSGMPGQMGIHQSFFTTAPPSATLPQDPRRLKDASTRQMMAQELMEYLTQYNFEMETKHSLSQKCMTSPTQKDFNCMFQWLYHRIDPSYRFQKNIDQEVPPLLKQMRYPFEKSIMKSQIAAVGGNNWPTFLGLLHWMMQLARMMERFAAGEYDMACMEAGFDVTGDKIIFQFLTDAYRDWLQVEDDAEDEADRIINKHVEVMASKFDEANAEHLKQVEMLEAEHKALQDQIDDLGKNGPRIARLDEQIKILEEDRIKFEDYNKKMEAKVDKCQNRVQVLDEEIKKIEAELEQVEQEKSSLQEMVDKQGITIQDIDRMNAERERLQGGVRSASERLDETKRRIADKEFEATRKLDDLERTVEKYNTLGYSIGIMPETATQAKGQNFELILTLNETSNNFSGSQIGSSQSSADRLLTESGNGYQYPDLLNIDPRRDLKSKILSLRNDIRDRINAAQEADFENNEMLDKVKEAIDDKMAEVDALSHRVRAAEEEFEKTREITAAEKMRRDAEIERFEKDLAKLRDSLTTSLQILEQREMNTNIEYEQLTLRAAEIREQLHTEIERMLNDVIKFKVHVQKSLEDYEVFVAEEVDRECVEQQLGDDMEGVEEEL